MNQLNDALLISPLQIQSTHILFGNETRFLRFNQNPDQVACRIGVNSQVISEGIRLQDTGKIVYTQV